MKNETTFVLVKKSKEYSSGQLEHLAKYFDTQAEADKACDESNARALTEYAYGRGISEDQAAEDFTGPWLVVVETLAE